jgi:NADP-dependent 3-hydroxy acid dehydrogenase YdfG
MERTVADFFIPKHKSCNLGCTQAHVSVRQAAPRIIESTLKAFGRIDGLVVNHGTLSPITKISDTDVMEWKQAYDINIFSAVALVSLLVHG